MSYPKFLYHRDYEPLLVKTEEQEKKLGAGWEDSPAKFDVVSHPEKKDDDVIDISKPRKKVR
jgi:hypothetical protein